MEVVASLSQGRTAAAQCGLFTHKSVPVIFEPPCTIRHVLIKDVTHYVEQDISMTVPEKKHALKTYGGVEL